MNTTDFICGLMRRNTDELGFIPRPYVAWKFVRLDRFILQRNRFRKPIGYLLHGPVNPDGTLRIYQACIELDRRNRGFGHQAVDQLVARARSQSARTILLRCASDLDAVAFWKACGFLPIHMSRGGRRRRRTLINYKLDLTWTLLDTPQLGDSGQLRVALHRPALRPP